MKHLKARFTVLLSLLIFGAGAFAFAAPANAGRAIDVSPMASDGVRYFAYLTPARVPVVLDTFKRKTNRITGAKGCLPLDVGGSRVLLTCGRADKNHMRVTRTAPASGGKAVRMPNDKSGFWFAIGRNWVEGNAPCTGTGGCLGGRAYVNWRTGQIDSPDGIPGLFDKTDLNGKKPKYLKPPFVPASHVKGWRVCWSGNLFVTDDGTIRLWKSRKRSIILGKGGLLKSECDPYGRLSVGSGRVTWNRGRVIHAYNARTGSSYKRKLRKPTRIVPVRRGAVIATKTREGKHDHYRVRFIRLR